MSIPTHGKQPFLWQLGVMGLLFGSLTAALPAADILEMDASRHGKVLREAFRELVSPIPHYVLEVEINGKLKTPGTLLQAEQGLAVTKASELGEYVSEEDRFRCRLAGGKWSSARFLGSDSKQDLVYLQIELPESEQQPVPIATSEEVGQWVVSLAFGQPLPVGVGVFGAKPREIETAQGQVGLNVHETREGLKVTQVLANSGAAQAGIRKGDLIWKEAETPATKRSWLSKELGRYEPGDWCPLWINRDGEMLQVNLRLGISWDNMVGRQEMMNRFGSDLSARRSGFRSVFQHDTLIHPRYCGGPLVNLQGELVGVNIARAGRTDTLAILAEDLLDKARELLEKSEQPE